MHISWKTSPCWGARTLRLSNCHGAFFYWRGPEVPPSSLRKWRREGRKEERAGTSAKSPKRQQRKLDRGTVDGSPLSPKRLHRRWEPSPALFQHFATLFYLTPRPTLLCDWIIQIPFSVLSRLPVLVANRAHTPPFPSTSIRRFSPPDDFPPPFSSRCCCLWSIYWCHMLVKGPVIAHRSSDKCRSCNIPTLLFRIGGVWAKTVVAAWTA